jgi:hypothetical protein
MSGFSFALTALIDQVHGHRAATYLALPGYENPPSRDLIAASDHNVRIAVEVFGESGLLDEFYQEEDKLDFGTFENCREYGLTVTVGGWTFAAYEHRNSDDICIEGTRTADVKPYGPYGTDDKYDVLFTARWKQYHEAAKAINAIARYVLDHPKAERFSLKHVAAAAEDALRAEYAAEDAAEDASGVLA